MSTSMTESSSELSAGILGLVSLVGSAGVGRILGPTSSVLFADIKAMGCVPEPWDSAIAGGACLACGTDSSEFKVYGEDTYDESVFSCSISGRP